MPLSCLCSFVGPFFRLLCWRLKSPVDFVPIEFHSAMKWNQVLVLSKKMQPPVRVVAKDLFPWRHYSRIDSFLLEMFLPFPLARREKLVYTCQLSQLELSERFPKSSYLPVESPRALQFRPLWVLCFSFILSIGFWRMAYFCCCRWTSSEQLGSRLKFTLNSFGKSLDLSVSVSQSVSLE